MTGEEKGTERERLKWVKSQRAKHVKFVKGFYFHRSATFMDYLHGDVNEDEAFIACCWEYMRESQSFRDAAKRRDEMRAELLAKGLCAEKAIETAANRALEEAELQKHTV